MYTFSKTKELHVASGENGGDGIVEAIEYRVIQPWWVFLGPRCLRDI